MWITLPPFLSTPSPSTPPSPPAAPSAAAASAAASGWPWGVVGAILFATPRAPSALAPRASFGEFSSAWASDSPFGFEADHLCHPKPSTILPIL